RMERKERSRLGSCKTPLGCSISQFFTFARKYSSQSWEPYFYWDLIPKKIRLTLEAIGIKEPPWFIT
ncbi:hypothetical protein, partial [Turicimonas muris]|uniref:hypothetical protein n=1 Tax=Turicimonas muris TaxID=1796652 RepID=UPI001C3F0D05